MVTLHAIQRANLATALLAVCLAQANFAAAADFTPVDLTNTNQDLRSYTNGTLYPTAPSSLPVGGVPFDLVTNGAVLWESSN